MANSLAQYLADLQVQIKESETQLVFGEVISTSPLRVKYGEITLEDNFLFVEDGLTLTVGQKVPMLKTNRSQLFIVMLSKETEHQEVTPEEILSAIKTVDGSGSGLDADLLDGKHASDFSLDGHTQDWATITGKPSTFAPSAHNQSWTTITDKPTTATRWPAWSEVTSKPTTFAPSSHTHSYLPLSGGTLTGNLSQSASSSTTVGSFTRLTSWANQLDGKAYNWHIHLDGTNALLGYTNSSGTRTTYNLTSHTHTWAQVTGKPAQSTRWPAWSEVTSKPSTFAPSTHTHSRSQTTLRSATNISAGGDYSLSQAITNFDMIVVHYSTNYSSSTVYNADTFVLYPHGHPTSGTTPWSTYHAQTNRYVTWQFTSTTNLRCVALGHTTSPRIRAVYGIKFTA